MFLFKELKHSLKFNSKSSKNSISDLFSFDRLLIKNKFSTTNAKSSLLLNKTISLKTCSKNSVLKLNSIGQHRYLLETTRIKLINCIDDATDYINSLVKERDELEKVLAEDQENLSDKHEKGKRLSYLNDIAIYQKKLQKYSNDINELKEMAREMIENENEKKIDEKMKSLIQDDYDELNTQLLQHKIEMVDLLVPDDPEDNEDAILELSAGVGGAESRLFLSELFEMYKKFSENREWSFNAVKIDAENEYETRKATVEITGTNVFKYFKFESGVHRVQRVPKTEQGGRVHTSTVGVVVYPKPTKINIKLNPKDLKIETKTSGGPGGQHANKIETAVRIVHLPTGIEVFCVDERSQIRNRAIAFATLEQKLYNLAYEEQLNKRQKNRQMQIGSSGRSERIRTYNFLQDRITDHRLNENFNGMNKFLSSETLELMLESLQNEQKIEILYEVLNKI